LNFRFQKSPAYPPAMFKKYTNVAKEGTFAICSFDELSRAMLPHTFKILWCKTGWLNLRVDLKPISLHEGEVLCLTPSQRLDAFSEGHGIAFQYDRAF